MLLAFSYNWLQSFFEKKLPKPKELADILTMHFAEVTETKKEREDFILDIDVKPSRAPDCLSHLGVAREIAAILNSKFQIPDSKLVEDKKLKAKNFVSVEVKDKTACPRYTARVITDVKVGPSPKWIKDRLMVCGLKPINNIVDIANYVMLETGQPLHAFDGKKIEGNKIIVRFAKNKEKIVTLDEQKFDLDSDNLVIADTKKPVAIAGIKGGKLPEVDNKTKTVIIESANFNLRVIRHSSQKLKLRTDASIRFEHGIDPNLTEFAINRVVYLVQEIAKGRITKGLVDVYPKKVLPKIVKLDLNYLESLLGIKIPKNEVIKILKRLGFNILHSTFNILTVEVPTRRLDVSIQEDLIEEIGRMYGYEKIPVIFPISSLIPPKKNLDIFWENSAKNILKEAGFTEVYNYSFISEKDAQIIGGDKEDLVEVENPLSSDFQYLRPSLIPGLLKDMEKNQKTFPEIKIFELGKVFKKSGEKRILAGLIRGDAFFETKGLLNTLFNKLGISTVFYDDYQPTPEASKLSLWNFKRCAEIKIGGEEFGFFGEISPRIYDNFNIKGKVVLFDIDFEKLSKICSEEHEYRPISKFPSAIRDVAVLVPRETRIEEVLNKIEIVGGQLVRDVDLFDIYEGEELPGGKKNLAFHIIYQAEDRTLSSKEIDELQNKIIKNLEEKPEWQVRK